VSVRAWARGGYRENILGENFSRKPKITFISGIRFFYLSAEIFIDFESSSSKPTTMYLGYKEEVQNATIYFF
jgi:hypothetical protein